MLKNDSGVDTRFEDYNLLEDDTVNYFKNIYSGLSLPIGDFIREELSRVPILLLFDDMIHSLQSPFTFEEIKETLFQMKPYKLQSLGS